RKSAKCSRRRQPPNPAGAENMRKATANARRADRGRAIAAAVARKSGKKDARKAAPAKTVAHGKASGKNGRAAAERGSHEKVLQPAKIAPADSAVASRGKYVYCVIEA